MTLNNEALKALIAEYGDKIFLILLNNGRKLIFGIGGEDPRRAKANPNDFRMPVCVGDIEFKTLPNGTDMFGIPLVSSHWDNVKVPYHAWYTTQFIEAVMATDELGDFVPDITGYI